ncbi:hypothetical protein BU14_1618s0002 [Porphyra umbilicalis]|uniref:Uncharacterized protein n=1 Tax=Porphyra umbilicalis TaxID=2786 RepID=A0A1X6NL63_PORUM|nr:hypothetical protein BU14_1618s0002 [Porphyra umbilicalis]|eukprot:OSX69327.1 hypothetical protein BU14_1618s0002 [Porphyra umbilicalis]
MAARMPMPSAADQENKESMRAVVAAAAAALGCPASADTSIPDAYPSAASASAPASTNWDCYRGFMAYQSMEHHAEVARRQEELAADRPPSPDPATLPLPSFYTSQHTPSGTLPQEMVTVRPKPVEGEAGAASVAPSAGASGGDSLSVPRTDVNEIESLRKSAHKAPHSRSRLGRAGSRRPIINPGSGHKPFISERARAAAAKRGRAAAARGKTKGVASLISLPGAAKQARPSEAGRSSGSAPSAAQAKVGGAPIAREAVASAALISLSACAGTAKRPPTPPSASSPGVPLSAAAEAEAVTNAAAVLDAAKMARQARTAAATKASMAARLAEAAAAGKVLGSRKAAGAGKAAVGRTTTGSGKSAGAGKAAGASKAAGSSKAAGAGEAAGAVKVIGAVQIILDAEKELAKLKRKVADLLKLKKQLVNLVATFKMNTEEIDTHGHSLERQASAILEIRAEMRKFCKPAPRPFAGSDMDGDDDEEEEEEPVRPVKRVWFALDEPVVKQSTPTAPSGADSSVLQSQPS